MADEIVDDREDDSDDADVAEVLNARSRPILMLLLPPLGREKEGGSGRDGI